MTNLIKLAGMKLDRNHVVAKRNILNEFRPINMTLQELRFFTIYLSRINPMDEGTRIVRFPLVEFEAIMEFGSKVHVTYLKGVVDKLLTKVTGMPNESGSGMIRFQIFKECKIVQDDRGEWQVEIDAHDRALPFMFDLREHYFRYELWNALRLKSKNQLRMYEILKQYEKVGYRVVSIVELKGLLGIAEEEYPQYRDFRRDVLDVCQDALAECTDIFYMYEAHGKRGRGGKIYTLKFRIIKNRYYIDSSAHERRAKPGVQASIYDEIDFTDVDEYGNLRATGTSPIYEDRIALLMGVCNNEFSREEIMVLYGLMSEFVPHLHADEIGSQNFLQQKYRELLMYSKKTKITHRFGYIKKLIMVSYS